MKENNAIGCAETAIPDERLLALSARFASRGLAKSVSLDAEAQIEAEEKTRASAPCSYRLSLLSEETVRYAYRDGKETMSGADLLRYVEESREIRAKGKDFSECESLYENETALVALRESKSVSKPLAQTVRKKLSAVPSLALNTVKTRVPLWFDFKAENKNNGRKAFPLSTFAAILAITVSMMLIVTSALMVAGVETEISELNSEISQLDEEVKDLESELESRSDLLEIRRIAVEEYGMVEEKFINTEHISLDSSEKIEAFERDRDREIGLSAILSAIGWKK